MDGLNEMPAAHKAAWRLFSMVYLRVRLHVQPGSCATVVCSCTHLLVRCWHPSCWCAAGIPPVLQPCVCSSDDERLALVRCTTLRAGRISCVSSSVSREFLPLHQTFQHIKVRSMPGCCQERATHHGCGCAVRRVLLLCGPPQSLGFCVCSVQRMYRALTERLSQQTAVGFRCICL